MIECDDFQRGYVDAARKVFRQGEPVMPRGQMTYELLEEMIVLKNPRKGFAIDVGRSLREEIGIAEGLQLIAGIQHPVLMRNIANVFEKFQEGSAFHGAYGPRVRGQLPNVIKRLSQDPYSRRAIATIWDPTYDAAYEDSVDYPCTIAFQFTLRNGCLNMHTRMRSNDVWLGLPYDMIQFTMLHQAVANALSAPLGSYYHSAVSLHLYDRDSSKVNELLYPNHSREVLVPTAVGSFEDSWGDIVERARELLQGKTRNDSTESEQYLAATVRAFIKE